MAGQREMDLINTKNRNKLSTIPHPPMGASGNTYSHDTLRSSLLLATNGNMEVTPLITGLLVSKLCPLGMV